MLQKLLCSYQRYYDINTENPAAPFCAEAVFKSHNEQYVLVKAAKIADIDSNEYVFFAQEDGLSSDRLKELTESAWNTGLGRIKPYYGHRNSDVTLIVIAGHVEAEVMKAVKKIRFSKSYKFSLYGWSSFRLVVHEVSSGLTASNWQGRDLKKLFNKGN